MSKEIRSAFLFLSYKLLTACYHDKFGDVKRHQNHFKMKDIAEASMYLELELLGIVQRNSKFVSRELYSKFLENLRMNNSKSITTLIEKVRILALSDCRIIHEGKKSQSKVPYYNVIGGLMYDLLSTRSDIIFAIKLITQFQSNLGFFHWQAVKRIFIFLLGTSDFMLCSYGGDLRLKGF